MKQRLVYQEQFGDVTPAQLLAYRKYNVAPIDHQMLVDEFGEQNWDTITLVVKTRSGDGYYRHPLPW